ncbi:uncharacterized protein [Panulirus ornatus]|uniref:uncharacterized protein n=1 Tax=Panulirus ornatus TaxID=150431 RepID=UPI003A85DDE3
MHQSLFLLPLLLAAYTVGGVRSSAGQERSASRAQDVVEWPKTGISLCQRLQEPHFRQKCLQCFTKAWDTMKEVKECARTWLPRVVAKCAIYANTNSFNYCITRQTSNLEHITKRAELLYKKGGAVLKKVKDSKVIKDGPSAVFSIMAQELFINTNPLKNTLKAPDNDCFERFQVDSANEHWHLQNFKIPKPKANNRTKIQALLKTRTTFNQLGARNLVYEYGMMGHKMPFHGIGPLAVDILKGICLMHYLEGTKKLQTFVDMSLSSLHPIPAWMFQESLNKISSTVLPNTAPSA